MNYKEILAEAGAEMKTLFQATYRELDSGNVTDAFNRVIDIRRRMAKAIADTEGALSDELNTMGKECLATLDEVITMFETEYDLR